jgi:multicomponent Na+:H+ antiporter subunit C
MTLEAILAAAPGLYPYWLVVVLMMIGFHAVIARANLIKKLLGLGIFQAGVFVLYIAMGYVDGGTAPIVLEGADRYANPLPSVLILTAIVVGVATLAVGLSLSVRIFEAYGTIDDDEIVAMDRARRDEP